MLFISIGLLIAHVALAAAVFALGGEHPWMLALLLGWYGIAMMGFIAAVWVHYKRATRRVGLSH
ncbi:UNVERIFIED_ORG: ribose/xylose/arabinose/galactoside ABC-type transport system permease subunit [Rhizobium etli]